MVHVNLCSDVFLWHSEAAHNADQGCSLGLDVSVSRGSGDSFQTSRSR